MDNQIDDLRACTGSGSNTKAKLEKRIALGKKVFG